MFKVGLIYFIILFNIIIIGSKTRLVLISPIFELLWFFELKYWSVRTYIHRLIININNIKVFMISVLKNRSWKINILFSTCVLRFIPLINIDNIIDLNYEFPNIEIKEYYIYIQDEIIKASLVYNKALNNPIIMEIYEYIFSNNFVIFDFKALLCNYALLEVTLENILNLIEIDPNSIDSIMLRGSSSSSYSPSSPSGESSSSDTGSNQPSGSNSGNSEPSGSNNNSNNNNNSSSNNSNNPKRSRSDIINNEEDNNKEDKPYRKKLKTAIPSDERPYEVREAKKEELTKSIEVQAKEWERRAEARRDYYNRWSTRIRSLRGTGINDIISFNNEFQNCFASEEHRRIKAEYDATQQRIKDIADERSSIVKYPTKGKNTVGRNAIYYDASRGESIYKTEYLKLRILFHDIYKDVTNKDLFSEIETMRETLEAIEKAEEE